MVLAVESMLEEVRRAGVHDAALATRMQALQSEFEQALATVRQAAAALDAQDASTGIGTAGAVAAPDGVGPLVEERDQLRAAVAERDRTCPCGN